MIRLAFVIPGVAVGKKEGAKIGRKRDGRQYPYIYTATKTRHFMAEVKARAQLAVLESDFRADLPTDDALAIEIVAFFPRPKSAPLTQKWPIAKPDATNIQKAVEDALHGVVFTNDSHVVDIHTAKRYCVNDMEPCTRVAVWTAGTLQDNLRTRREGGP